MSALRPLHWQEIENLLFSLGYELNRQKGSHRIYVKSGKLWHVTVPMCRTVPVGTIKSIIRQMEISRDEFLYLILKQKH